MPVRVALPCATRAPPADPSCELLWPVWKAISSARIALHYRASPLLSLGAPDGLSITGLDALLTPHVGLIVHPLAILPSFAPALRSFLPTLRGRVEVLYIVATTPADRDVWTDAARKAVGQLRRSSTVLAEGEEALTVRVGWAPELALGEVLRGLILAHQTSPGGQVPCLGGEWLGALEEDGDEQWEQVRLPSPHLSLSLTVLLTRASVLAQDELHLSALPHFNAFMAAWVLYSMTIDDFLQSPADERLATWGPLFGRQRMVRTALSLFSSSQTLTDRTVRPTLATVSRQHCPRQPTAPPLRRPGRCRSCPRDVVAATVFTAVLGCRPLATQPASTARWRLDGGVVLDGGRRRERVRPGGLLPARLLLVRAPPPVLPLRAAHHADSLSSPLRSQRSERAPAGDGGRTGERPARAGRRVRRCACLDPRGAGPIIALPGLRPCKFPSVAMVCLCERCDAMRRRLEAASGSARTRVLVAGAESRRPSEMASSRPTPIQPSFEATLRLLS